MDRQSDVFAPAPLPAGDEPDSVNTRRAWLRLLAQSAATVVLGFAAFWVYALVYPERMPPVVGGIVEEITGANPPGASDAPAASAAQRGRRARQTDLLRQDAVRVGSAVVRDMSIAAAFVWTG